MGKDWQLGALSEESNVTDETMKAQAQSNTSREEERHERQNQLGWVTNSRRREVKDDPEIRD